MIMERIILSATFLLIPIINGLPSNSYYLIDIDNSVSSNETYCSNILINQGLYRIPEQCHHHLLCKPYHCDDKSFRCIKIREALCCLYKYFQLNCQHDTTFRIKEFFRAINFPILIEHGYCEINSERIETNDESYCIANDAEKSASTKPTIIATPRPQTVSTNESSSFRSPVKYFHRRPSTSLSQHHHDHPNPHRIATRQNYSLLFNSERSRLFTIIDNIPSKCSRIFIDYCLIIIVLLSILT